MLKSFIQFVVEGGNVKIGSVAAAPFPISEKSRAKVRSDAHEALSALHDSFHKATGEHLFGKDKKALTNKSAFVGSTRHLMGHEVSDKEFSQHKRDVGDFDVLIPHEHKDALHNHIQTGMKLGNYTVAGKNKSSTLMQHKNGQIHQFDFVASKYEKGEPTHGEQFSHNATWSDTTKGIKGAHHKILLNAVGGSTHKFSISHGVRSRTDESDPGNKDPKHVTKTLFGAKANPDHVESFQGVAKLIKQHVPAERHQEIYDKFKKDVGAQKKLNNKPALEHLRSTLGVKDTVTEATNPEKQTHHTSVVPLVGFSPISHMGHAADLGSAMAKLPGKKHIGISSKADLFSPEERSNILKRQWGQKDITHHVTSSAGDVVAKAYHSLPKTGKKELHLLVGGDRAEWAHGLKKSLEAGKIKEMGDNKFDRIHVHTPEDTERKHGMSGTAMRTAAASPTGLKQFHKHLGNMFSREEAINIKNKISSGIKSGKLTVKR